jgi:hypothetical protein
MDERQAKLALYPPRALQQPGSSSAIIEVRRSQSYDQEQSPPFDQEDDRQAAEGSWPSHG